MIVYKNQQTTRPTSLCLTELERAIDRLAESATVRHADAVDLLIGFGELETAAADTLSGDKRERQICPLLRRVGIVTGHVFCCSWENNGHTDLWVHMLKKNFRHLIDLPLPETLAFRIPEGYAYYNLYPETYLEAAQKFYREVGPEQVVCIGLRSIGTSLSSVVSATLENVGCKVGSFTVRPEGHPYCRQVRFGAVLEEYLREMKHPFFVLVDEGPGLSGSSLCGTAQALSQLGIPDNRIVFVPGYKTDGSTFISEAARGRWNKHRHYTVDFEEIWIHNRRLMRNLPDGPVADLSGGQWRPFLSDGRETIPPYSPAMSGASTSSGKETDP